MIVFELTMPHAPTWNGKWSGEDYRHIRIRENKRVPKSCWNKEYLYCWSDGWCASISVRKLPAKEARRLEEKSVGFCGYDWMIDSIIKHGEIISPTEEREMGKG